ncbi:MAG: hypothetical protein J4F40_08155 [Alphaproteobacteria bacterium]|nr:hypothetical protein [Alphaproteobacteria bacterium]MCY4514570.1 hypothetical protein [Candidatus Tectomicrobia bacterium]
MTAEEDQLTRPLATVAEMAKDQYERQTKGFRDVLAIGTGQRFTGGLFDPRFRKAPPLIKRSWRFEVDERMSYLEESLKAPSDEQLGEIAKAIEVRDVEAVAGRFLHAYSNDAHEHHAVAFLKDALPDCFIC